MAFPTVSAVLDDFNRATLGGNWTVDVAGFGASLMATASSTFLNPSLNGVYGDGFWNLATYGPDTEIYVTLVSEMMGTNGTLILFGRMQSPGSAAADGYELQVTRSAGTDSWTILRITNGAEFSLNTGSQELTLGDKVGFELLGNILTAYYFSGGVWSAVVSYDISGDGTKYTGAGNVGIGCYNGGSGLPKFDDFVAGTTIGGGGGGAFPHHYYQQMRRRQPFVRRGALWVPGPVARAA